VGRDFVTQVWAADFASLGRGRETAFYREHLKDDEDQFVDQATVVFLPVRERELFSRAQPPQGAFKLFGLLKRAEGAGPAAFAQAWAEAAAVLLAASDFAAAPSTLLRHVQNEVLGRPGSAPPLHGIDEFWFADEAAAREWLLMWRQAVHAALVNQGLAAGGVPLVLLAREDVVHAGPL
jgi:vanillate O-demethylase ferredoxin subunit